MSERIEFTKNGIVVHEWNGNSQKFICKSPEKTNIITCLRTRCEIAEGTTLRKIFEAVAEYDFLKLVIAQYSWCKQIDAFHAQANEQKIKSDDGEIIDYLEIYHHPETNSFVENNPDGSSERIVAVDFCTSASFHGIGHDQDGSTINYAVSYSPMWELADLPVKLNQAFDVYEPFNPKKHNRNLLPEKIMSVNREFTLLEVLDAIYWDISFAGGPEENIEFLKEMTETIDDIKSGKVSLIPFEQISNDI